METLSDTAEPKGIFDCATGKRTGVEFMYKEKYVKAFIKKLKKELFIDTKLFPKLAHIKPMANEIIDKLAGEGLI